MKGKRLPDNSYPGNPGEYSRQTHTGSEAGSDVLQHPYWAVRTPNGHHGNLEKHTVTENADGTITVNPSISVKTSMDGGKTWIEEYHGWLKGGVWTEA